MTLTIIQVNNLELITIVKPGDGDVLHLYCYDKKTERSYNESLTMDQFMQRIRLLNKRVHFPIKAVRTALDGAKPMEATFAIEQFEDVKGGAEQKVKQEVGGKVQRTLLGLKYRIEGAPAPLIWEWQLVVMDSALFYRTLLTDVLSATSFLNGAVNLLLDVVKKKDIEIKQYRTEGTQLRRSTVATKPFDITAFQMQHNQMLISAYNFCQVDQLLNNSGIAMNEVVVESPKAKDVLTTIPGTPTQQQLQSPRSKKRKAFESSMKHLERKALHRRRMIQMQYRNSQSQEEELDGNKLKTEAPNVKPEITEIKAAEPKAEPSSQIDDFEDIMRIINAD